MLCSERISRLHKQRIRDKPGPRTCRPPYRRFLQIPGRQPKVYIGEKRGQNKPSSAEHSNSAQIRFTLWRHWEGTWCAEPEHVHRGLQSFTKDEIKACMTFYKTAQAGWRPLNMIWQSCSQVSVPPPDLWLWLVQIWALSGCFLSPSAASILFWLHSTKGHQTTECVLS